MVSFKLGDMYFEYDEWKNQYNINEHGISFKTAARVFFDFDRIELYDEENSSGEDRYDTIGDISAGTVRLKESLGVSVGLLKGQEQNSDILYVVYAERFTRTADGKIVDVTRLISARLATKFERGVYYGKY